MMDCFPTDRQATRPRRGSSRRGRPTFRIRARRTELWTTGWPIGMKGLFVRNGEMHLVRWYFNPLNPDPAGRTGRDEFARIALLTSIESAVRTARSDWCTRLLLPSGCSIQCILRICKMFYSRDNCKQLAASLLQDLLIATSACFSAVTFLPPSVSCSLPAQQPLAVSLLECVVYTWL